MDEESRSAFSMARWPLGGFWLGNGLLLCGGFFGLFVVFVRALVYGRMLEFGFSWYFLLGALLVVGSGAGGVFSLYVSVQLFRKKKGGLYGSLILGFAMLFFFPFALLIHDPTDYVGPTVTGSIAMLVVYLSIIGTQGL